MARDTDFTRKVVMSTLVMVLSIFSLSPKISLSTPNPAISEREVLLGVDDNGMYGVFVLQWKGTESHFQSILSYKVRWYDLDTNDLILSSILDELVVDIDATIGNASSSASRSDDISLTPITEAIGERIANPAGFYSSPIKPFILDKGGIYVRSSNDEKDYVLDSDQLLKRLPELDEGLEIKNVAVIGLHVAWVGNQKRYFAVIRAGHWRGDEPTFERVVSLPEN